MPFASRRQQRFMFAAHPQIARRWADHTPDFKALPETAPKAKKKRPKATTQAKEAHAAGSALVASLRTFPGGGTSRQTEFSSAGKAAICGVLHKIAFQQGVLASLSRVAAASPPRVCSVLSEPDPLTQGALALRAERQSLAKAAFAPPPPPALPPPQAPGNPWEQLMGMMRPGPPVGPAGTNQPPPASEPGQATLGGNTPTTNPIGLMSGLGKDPGGSSVMGNAAFGTQNNAMKMGQAAIQGILAKFASGNTLQPQMGKQPQPYKPPAAPVAPGPAFKIPPATAARKPLRPAKRHNPAPRPNQPPGFRERLIGV